MGRFFMQDVPPEEEEEDAMDISVEGRDTGGEDDRTGLWSFATPWNKEVEDHVIEGVRNSIDRDSCNAMVTYNSITPQNNSDNNDHHHPHSPDDYSTYTANNHSFWDAVEEKSTNKHDGESVSSDASSPRRTTRKQRPPLKSPYFMYPSVVVRSSPSSPRNQHHQMQAYYDDNGGGLMYNPYHASMMTPPPRRRRYYCGWWCWILSGIAVANILAKYAPENPPRSLLLVGESWDDLWLHMIHTLFLVCQLPLYVGTTCYQRLHQDVQQTVQDWTRPPPCPIQVQSHYSEEDHEWTLVGQEAAKQMALQVFQGWKQDMPLLLFLSGGVGVGKLQLAQDLARLVFSHCSSDNTGVLLLTGRQFSHEDDDSNNAIIIKDDFYRVLLDHVQRTDGAVIIIQHVEDMSTGILQQFLAEISSSQEDVSVYSKTVFIFTSYVGGKTISQSIRSHGGISSIPLRDLDVLLRHEIDQNLLSLPITSNSYSSSQKQLSYHHDLTESLHAVIPLFPIEKHILEEILKKQIVDWAKSQDNFPPLSITTTALQTILLNPQRIDYLTILKKSSLTSLLTFSSTGGKPLNNPSMRSWQGPVLQCYYQKQQRQSTMIQDHDTIPALQEPQSQQLIVDASPRLSTELLLLYSCPITMNNIWKEDNEAELLHYHCDELCRIPFL